MEAGKHFAKMAGDKRICTVPMKHLLDDFLIAKENSTPP
jgi:hypothetical protein